VGKVKDCSSFLEEGKIKVIGGGRNYEFERNNQSQRKVVSKILVKIDSGLPLVDILSLHKKIGGTDAKSSASQKTAPPAKLDVRWTVGGLVHVDIDMTGSDLRSQGEHFYREIRA